MIRLNLVSVGMVEETGSVVLVLRSADLEQLLVIEVGLLEGRAIVMEAEGVRAPRPLTHELMHQVIEQLDASVSHVFIRDVQDKTFFADLVLTTSEGTEIRLDARPSDAIVLALRTEAAIYVADPVMEGVGIVETPDLMESEDMEGDEPRVIH